MPSGGLEPLQLYHAIFSSTSTPLSHYTCSNSMHERMFVSSAAVLQFADGVYIVRKS